MKLIVKVTNKEVNLEYLSKKLRTLKDGYYEFNIRKNRSIRSINQCNYYFGVLIKECCEYFKDEVTKDQMHELFGYELLRRSYSHPITGELIEKVLSTTKLNTKEMEDYLERCRKYMMENYNFRVPLPNETIYNY